MFNGNNLQVLSDVNPQDLENAINKIKPDNGLKGLGKYFSTYEDDYNVNAIIMAAIACLESAYGTSKLAKEKSNLFGLDAKDSLVGTDKYGSGYKSKSDSVKHAFHRIGKQYIELDPDCKWRYVGAKDIYSVGKKWCSKSDWADKVVNIANRLQKNIQGGNYNMGTICVNFGHAASGKGTGAAGILNESKENREVGNELVKLLKENSTHKVIVADYNGSDNYVKSVNYANSQGATLFVSIHFNSGANDKGGNGMSCGTETLVYSANQDNTIAKRINSNIVKLGFRDRRKNTGGILVRNDLYVLKKTKMPALLVECCFVDDRDDVNLYNYKTMAKAIAEGILDKSISSGSSNNASNSTYTTGTYQKNVKITADTLNVRSGRGANFDKVGAFLQNQIVNVWFIDKASDGSLWGSCSCNGKTGYMHMGYAVPV